MYPLSISVYPALQQFLREDESVHLVKEKFMSPLGFLVLLIVAAVCGALGQAIAGYSVGGCLISIVVGYIGAFLGVWIARQFGFPQFFVITIDGEPFPIVWSIIGSAILAVIVGLLSRPRVAT